jgi:carbonic anhydrase/acetyltransferase-like protein (isoleucine patch superfamily)
MLYALGEYRPQLPQHYFIAPNASVIGQVLIAENVSIWFNVVIRADNDTVTLGAGSNIQDSAVIHVDPGIPLSVGEGVTVGHKAMLHGCTIGDGSLIGMNAVVLNHAKIGRNCLIGANALVTEGMVIPDDSLVLGSPAKVVKQVSDKAKEGMRSGAQSYIDKIALYKQEFKAL